MSDLLVRYIEFEIDSLYKSENAALIRLEALEQERLEINYYRRLIQHNIHLKRRELFEARYGIKLDMDLVASPQFLEFVSDIDVVPQVLKVLYYSPETGTVHVGGSFDDLWVAVPLNIVRTMIP